MTEQKLAGKYLYLSPCFCRHIEKAEEQHSWSKHSFELFMRKVQMQESEWREHQDNLKINSVRHWNEISAANASFVNFKSLPFLLRTCYLKESKTYVILD